MTNPSNAIMVYGLWGFRFFAKQNRVLPRRREPRAEEIGVCVPPHRVPACAGTRPYASAPGDWTLMILD